MAGAFILQQKQKGQKMTIPARFLRLLGLIPKTYPFHPIQTKTARDSLSRALKAQAYYDRHNHPAGWSR